MYYVRAIFGGELPNLYKRLTLRHQPKIGAPVIVKLYRFTKIGRDEFLVLPRSTCRPISRLLSRVEVRLPALRPVQLQLRIDLFENQRIVVDHLMQNIFTAEAAAAGLATCVLDLRAGAGKTYVAAAIMARLGVRTLYITTKRSLMYQAVKDFKVCFGDDAPVDVHGGKMAAPAITVIVINTAMKQPAEFFAGYSFVVLDEIHELCSEVRRNIFWNLPVQYILGMSATTEELFNEVFRKHLGPVVKAETIAGFTYDELRFVGRAKIIKYNGPAEYTQHLTHPSTGMMFTTYMYRQFMNDPQRIRLVIDELITLYDWRGDEGQKHCIYVFAEEIKLLLEAKAAFEAELERRRRQDVLADAVIADDEMSYMFTGGLSAEQVETIIERARILFTTYGYSGTGTSIVKMTAMLFLTPRVAKMPQVLGRIQRRGSDMSIPRIVVDIVDNKTGLRGQVRLRKNAYRYCGFEIVESRVDAKNNEPA